MTVPVQNPYNSYTANGSTALFAFTFLITNAVDLLVTVNGATISPSDFVLTGVGQSAGGNVTFNAGKLPPANAIVIIRRAVIASRLTDYQNNGDLLADTLNADFDRVVMMIQDKQADQDTALKHPLGGVDYDALNHKIVNLKEPTNDQDAATKNYVDVQFNDVAQETLLEAKGYRDQAAASANAAAASASAANTSAGSASTSATTATQKATAAGTSATNAAASATAAALSASQALTSKNTADTRAADAESSAAAANASKTAAAASATAAAGSATTASQQATAATSAKTAAQTAQTNAEAAQQAAEDARDAANAANPALQLLKSANLNDVANKTTAMDNLGAMRKTGGIFTGKTVLNNNVHLVTQTGASATNPNVETDILYAGTNSLAIGSADQQTLIRSSSNPVVSVAGGATQAIYHGGNKPTLADVGAPTLAQLRSLVNLGEVQWFMGSRGTIPTGWVAADGQIGLRTDYPDLAALVDGGKLRNVAHATWVSAAADPNPDQYLVQRFRAHYSLGDATRFRFPDMNGAITGGTTDVITGASMVLSQVNLYVRGTSPGSESAHGGQIHTDGAPEIDATWGMNAYSSRGTIYEGQQTAGCAVGELQQGNVIDLSTLGVSANASQVYPKRFNLKASRSAASYGRSPTEIRPTSILGVWIIRAKYPF